MIMRRRMMLLSLSALVATRARAQSYPTRPVRFLVPFIPGSAPDVIARQIAERLSPALGQPVVVENRPGSGGNIGFTHGARAANDGYTLILGTNSLVINPALYARVEYDPLADFIPVHLPFAMPHLLAVSAEAGPRDLAALVALLKAEPGRHNYASGGNGSGAHLAAELLKSRAGVEAVHVPYRGAPDIINAVLGNQVLFGLPTMSTAMPLVTAGRLRAIAVTSPQRSPALPDVPTLAEHYPGAEVVSWFAVMVPAGTPAPIVARVDAAIRGLFADQAWVARMTADGTIAVNMGHEEFAGYYRGEAAKWAELVRLSGARVE
ncbi:tripartite tricarboxylate transporter substrate-binding protein [Elioraea tepidiphila]|jgi:tripartite-type tricarboxylate transporter receptor subunit TctC|uniref:Bug family tripartite tricarboxylate transporter substrate binding protein n=1 Tax=Elioraea tepidiphila TaxID=457934 RepID=UPI002FD89309